MNLNQLYYFKVLARLEHYTRAAEELQISQPTLSQSIASLENELGVRLFEKRGRNIMLTQNGRAYLKHVESALSELSEGRSAVEKFNRAENGHVRISFITNVGAFIVPRLITGFIANPMTQGISFSCREGNTNDLLNGLKDERYDMVICSKKDNEPSLDFTPLISQSLVVLVPVDHPLAEKRSLTLKETAKFPFIMHIPDSGMRTIENRLFDNVGVVPKISCEVEMDRTIAGLVAANLGVAIVSDGPDIENFNIKIIPLTEPYFIRYLYLVTVKNRQLSNAAGLFKSYVLSVSVNKS